MQGGGIKTKCQYCLKWQYWHFVMMRNEIASIGSVAALPKDALLGVTKPGSLFQNVATKCTLLNMDIDMML